MAKDDEKKDNGFTLEEILAEYGVEVSRWEGEEPPAEAPAEEETEEARDGDTH